MSVRATATSPAGAPGEVSTAHHAKLRLTPRAAILVFSIFLVSVFAVAPIRAYLDQRAHLQDLERQAAALTEQTRALERQIADLQDPRTLERLARGCLGMVRPGEVGFVVIPRGAAPTPPRCG
jgi:cell division protein FtsB